MSTDLERLIEDGGPQRVPPPPRHMKRHLFMSTGFGVSKLNGVFPFPMDPELDELTGLFFEQGDDVYIFPLTDEARLEIVRLLTGGVEIPKLHVQGDGERG